jgi:hypothetical protein
MVSDKQVVHKMLCKLCGKQQKLVESHIFPAIAGFGLGEKRNEWTNTNRSAHTFLDEAKKILPTLKRARRAERSGVDPQRTAAVLERFLSENEWSYEGF